MQTECKELTKVEKRTWKKNKLIGQKSPLTPPQVWAIRGFHPGRPWGLAVLKLEV